MFKSTSQGLHALRILLCSLLIFSGLADAASIMQTSFNAGELSPRLAGRVDLEKYSFGLSTCENAIVQPYGGVSRRPGTKYIATAGVPTAAVRLIPFEFSETQAYIIEAGDHYFRFYMDGGQILDGASAYEIATPYRAEDLSTLKWFQSADTMYLFHSSYDIRKLTRSAHTSWTLSVATITNRPSEWGAPSVTIDSISQDSPSGQVLTSSAHNLSNGDVVLITGVVGMTEINDQAFTVSVVDADEFTIGTDTSGYTAYTSGGEVDQTDQVSCGTFFEERLAVSGLQSDPQTVWLSVTGDFQNFDTYFIDERTISAITQANPGKVTTSVYHGLEEGDKVIITGVNGMTEVNGREFTVQADDEDSFFLSGVDTSAYSARTSGGYVSQSGSPGLTYTLASNQANVVRWLSSASKLVIGTTGGEWWMSGGGPDEPIAEDSVLVRQSSSFGSQNAQLVNIGNAIFFVQKPGRTVRRYQYSFEADDFAATDMTILSEHLTRSYAITEMAYQQTPWQVLWCVRADGDLLGMTYTPEHNVNGWHRHSTGTSDLFESTAVIPGSAFDEVWVVVKRYINGAWTRYIEQLQTSEWGYTYTSESRDPDLGGSGTATITASADSQGACQGSGPSNGIWDGPLFGRYVPGVAYDCDMFLRFTSVNLPKLCTIDSATITLYNGVTRTSDIGATIWGVDDDEAAMPTSLSEYAALVSTTATVAWTASSVEWLDSATKTTPDVKTIVQELVDRDDWDSGDTMLFILDNTKTAGSGFYEPGGALNHYLTITYSTSASPVTIEEITHADNAFFVDSGLAYDNPISISAATQASPVEITTSTPHGLITGDTVKISEVVGMGGLNGVETTVTVVDADQFTLDGIDGSFGYGTYSSGGYVREKVSSVSGLDHLEGETVAVWADGAVQDSKVVATGAITLATPAYIVAAGLPYDTNIETLPPNIQGDKGSTQALRKRIAKITARLFETVGGQAGPDSSHLDDFVFDDYDEAFFSGDVQAQIDGLYSTMPKVYLRQPDPAPFTLLGIIYEVDL